MTGRQDGRTARRQVVLALLLIAACKGKAEENGGTAAADTSGAGGSSTTLSLPVVAQEVRQGDLILSVTTTGQVRSEAIAIIKSETVGPIVAVLVRPGDRVRKGQPLVRVDPKPLDLAVQEAAARLEEARLKLLDYTVPDSIVSGKAVTGERLRSAEIRAGLEAARVNLEKAKLEREKATITAPFAGVMDEVKVALGERLTGGQEIGKLVDLDHLRIEAAVLEHDLPLIRVGGQAVVTEAAAPDRPVSGRVAAILPLVDTLTRAGRAIVRLSSGGVLRPGMYATVRIYVEGRTALTVPSSAVVDTGDRTLVFVDMGGGRLVPQDVETGRRSEELTEIVFGVEPGQRVVTSAQFLLDSESNLAEVMRSMIGQMSTSDMGQMDMPGMSGTDMSGRGR